MDKPEGSSLSIVGVPAVRTSLVIVATHIHIHDIPVLDNGLWSQGN